MILAYVKAGDFIVRAKQSDGTIRCEVWPMIVTGRAKMSIKQALPHLKVEFHKVDEKPEKTVNTEAFKSCRAIKEIIRRNAVPYDDKDSLKSFFAQAGGRRIEI